MTSSDEEATSSEAFSSHSQSDSDVPPGYEQSAAAAGGLPFGGDDTILDSSYAAATSSSNKRSAGLPAYDTVVGGDEGGYPVVVSPASTNGFVTVQTHERTPLAWTTLSVCMLLGIVGFAVYGGFEMFALVVAVAGGAIAVLTCLCSCFCIGMFVCIPAGFGFSSLMRAQSGQEDCGAGLTQFSTGVGVCLVVGAFGLILLYTSDACKGDDGCEAQFGVLYACLFVSFISYLVCAILYMRRHPEYSGGRCPQTSEA